MTNSAYSSGAGGLTTGMHRTGYVETCWAVEMSPSAAKTLQYVFALL
jgi:site-specific DNA-cytosine methylase